MLQTSVTDFQIAVEPEFLRENDIPGISTCHLQSSKLRRRSQVCRVLSWCWSSGPFPGKVSKMQNTVAGKQ